VRGGKGWIDAHGILEQFLGLQVLAPPDLHLSEERHRRGIARILGKSFLESLLGLEQFALADECLCGVGPDFGRDREWRKEDK
jgi:hypothetical protein